MIIIMCISGGLSPAQEEAGWQAEADERGQREREGEAQEATGQGA